MPAAKKELKAYAMRVEVSEDGGTSILNLYILDNDDPAHDNRPFALIEHLRTDPGCEGRGLASAALEEAERAARVFNCYKIMLATSSTEPNVRHLYEKMGFVSDYKTCYWKSLESSGDES